MLVRRVQQGGSWHPADDQLRGTDVYGQYPANVRNADQARATFSVAFAGAACGLRRGAGTTSRAPTRRPASAGRSPRSTSRAARTCGCGSFDKAERQQEHWQYRTHHHTTTPPPSHSLTIDPNPSSLAAPVLQSLAAENFLNVRGATTRRFFYSFADTGASLARLRPWSYSLGLHV